MLISTWYLVDTMRLVEGEARRGEVRLIEGEVRRGEVRLVEGEAR